MKRVGEEGKVGLKGEEGWGTKVKDLMFSMYHEGQLLFVYTSE